MTEKTRDDTNRLGGSSESKKFKDKQLMNEQDIAASI